jgi:hypothetical protein
MEKKILNEQEFQEEILKIALASKNLKETTIKNKIKKTFEKYDELLAWDTALIHKMQENYFKLKRIRQVLKNKAIYYETTHKTQVILLESIECVTKEPNHVTVLLKIGKEIKLPSEFDFLIELFYL